MTEQFELHDRALDQIVHAALRSLAVERPALPRHTTRPRRAQLLVAALAAGVTLSVACLVGSAATEHAAQGPLPTIDELLRDAPVAKSLADLQHMPADTRALHVQNPDLAMVRALARIQSLRTLSISGGEARHPRLAPEIAGALLRHTRLTALELRQLAPVDQGAFALFARLPLRHLSLVGVGLPTDWRQISLRGLQTLTLAWSTLDDTGLRAAVAHLPALVDLHLRGPMKLSRGALAQLSQLQKLRTLRLSDWPAIPVDAARDLPRHIVKLDLRGSPVDAALLRAMTGLENLRHVSLRDAPDVPFDELVRACKGRWRHLDLRGAKIRPPSGSPAGSGPLQIRDPESFRVVLGVEELRL